MGFSRCNTLSLHFTACQDRNPYLLLLIYYRLFGFLLLVCSQASKVLYFHIERFSWNCQLAIQPIVYSRIILGYLTPFPLMFGQAFAILWMFKLLNSFQLFFLSSPNLFANLSVPAVFSIQSFRSCLPLGSHWPFSTFEVEIT